MRPTVADIDLGAIRHNVALLRRIASPAAVCAVVKADGYGHGATEAAVAALEAGATSLAVALVEEGIALREDGITARILLLSQPPLDAMDVALASNLEPAVYTRDGVQEALRAVLRSPGTPVWPLHLKVDTGMHRVGCAPDDALWLAQAIHGRPELVLGSVWTHGAVEDEVDNPFTAEQLKRFEDVVRHIGAESVPVPFAHFANSAGAIAHPETRMDLVRCGIAIYGLAPSPAVASLVPAPGLRPAMRLQSAVSLVKVVDAGERISYGLHHRFVRDTVIATVPIGYADGVPRSLGLAGGEVLIRGRRRPILGVVTMDQLMVACDDEVQIDDDVVLIGEQGTDRITADDVAGWAGTISYEIVCGISARVPAALRRIDGRVITDVPGVRVGHWTHPDAQTGCTVIVLPEGTVASGEVRGGAPATREFDLLAPERMVDRLDAVVLTGGSAFGLAAGDGAMRWCAEQGSGFPTGAGPVPIVVTLALFDLLVGDGSVRPGPVEGYAASAEARGGAVQLGRIGAGAGATIGKWHGRDLARPGGLGSATVRDGDLIVSALVALNAVGDIDDGVELDWPPPPPETVFGTSTESTTIGLIATNATLDKTGCFLVAQGGHDGLARALVPSHTRGDGDALVAAATGPVEALVDHVRFLAVRAVERAVRSVAPAGRERPPG